MLDRYPLRVPIKGGFAWWNPKQIFVTCPRLPEEEFVRHGAEQNQVYEDVEQVRRRCTTIRKWDERHNCWIFVKGSIADLQQE